MRVVYNKLTLEIVQVVEDESSITALPANVGVLQGDNDVIVITAQALGLDLAQITGLDMTPELAKVYEDKNFCREIHNRLLSSQKLTPNLAPEVYRQMVDTFKYAKEAADNGNPTHLKYELEQLSDDLPLDGWSTLKGELITEIDDYLI
jgi:hypothetical protein